MTTSLDLAMNAGRLAGRLGKPLTDCPYDPDDAGQAAQALAFVRGWQQTSGDQTAAVTDKHGHVHSPADGRFISGGSAGGAAKKAASKALDSRKRDDLNTVGFVGQADQARQRLRNAEIMHGSDRSKWTAKDRAAAARLDKVIAAADVDKAIKSGAPDALADLDRPALMKEAKRREIKIPRGAPAETIRDMLMGKPAPAAPAPAPKLGKVGQLEKKKKALQVKLERAEGKSRDERRNLQSDDEVALRAQIAKVDADIREAKKTPATPATPEAKSAAAVANIKDVVDQYVASDPDDSGPSTERVRSALAGLKAAELKQVRKDLAGLDMPVSQAGRTKDEMVRDILRGTIGFRADSRAMRNIAIESPFGAPKPVTSKMNAHSMSRGQQFWENGTVYTVRLHKEIARDGHRFIEFEVTDSAGNVSTMVKKLNQPLDRVVGGGGGGSGTFSLEEQMQTWFRAQLTELGVENPEEYTITYDVTSLLDQTAGVGDYDKAHGITRAHDGRFGRGTRLGDLLQNIAGGNDDEDADNFQLESGSGFDWTGEDHNGDRLLDITGRMSDDDADEDDEDYEEPGPASGLSRLHMSKKDMKRWASSMGNALLREEMLASPLDPDDPKTHLMVSMLETQDHTGVDFEGNPWDQSLTWHRDGQGGWVMYAGDEDDDSVSVNMTNEEFKALHAQVVRQVIDDNDAPARAAAEKLQARGQTAAADLAEFAMPDQLEDYWLHGKGAAKVRWCTRGAFRRARRALLAEGVPLESIGGTVRNLYVKACGREPGHKKKGLEMASEDVAYVALQQFPTQSACGCGGGDEVPSTYDTDGYIGEEAPAIELDMPTPDGAPSTSTGWRGPLAPIDIATGDKRKFAAGALGSRMVPLPFRWQERQERGHDGAVVVGALTGYQVLSAPEFWRGVTLPAGTIMGEGYFLDEDIIPDVRKAKHLAEHGVIGPSVDLEPTMQVSYVDKETGATFNPNECAQDGTCPAHGEAVITDATIAGATMVPITAFADCRAPELFTRTVNQDTAYAAQQTAAVAYAVDWDDVPIAPAGTPWDPAGARLRLLAYARAEDLPIDEAETDWRAFSTGFLWADDYTSSGTEFAGGRPDVENGYLFQIVDIIDGVPTIVPEAVFTAAARVDSAIIGSSAKREIRELLEDLYGQIAEEFGMDEEEFHAPWEREHQLSSGASADCGCADKWAKIGASQTAAGKYGVFGDMDPYPADAFQMRPLDKLTPVTIEQRPGEPFARVFGHAASWKSCNRGYRGVCVPPPKNSSGYAQFHLGAVRTDAGLLSVGKIVQGEGHPDTGTGARIAQAYYDRTSKTTAFVRAGDDKFGIQLAGVVAPGVTPEEVTMLLASPPSGDWKGGEMIAVLAVNVPGHVVPRATLIEGQPVNMVAAGRFWADDDSGMIEGEAELLELAFAQLDDDLWARDADRLAAILQGGE